MKFVKILLLLVIVLFNLIMSSCWSSREVNTLGIVTATGIDKSPKGYYVTIQMLNTRAIASEQQTNEAPVILYSEEGENVSDAIKRMTLQCPRNIYFSHIRLVVLGEELVKQDITDVIDYLSRNNEFRTDFHFVIAKATTANNILSILTPLETIPANKIYDSLELSEELWAPTKKNKDY